MPRIKLKPFHSRLKCLKTEYLDAKIKKNASCGGIIAQGCTITQVHLKKFFSVVQNVQLSEILFLQVSLESILYELSAANIEI